MSKLPTNPPKTWTASALYCHYIKQDCTQCPTHVYYGMHKALPEYEPNKCYMPETLAILKEAKINPGKITKTVKDAILSLMGSLNEEKHSRDDHPAIILRRAKSKNGQLHFRFYKTDDWNEGLHHSQDSIG